MTAKPSILFVHDAYPGQFGHLARHLWENGWFVMFATSDAPWPHSDPWPIIRYEPHRAPSPKTHPYAQSFERAAINGQACLRALMEASPPSPDIILSHAGPGAGLYTRAAFPRAKHIAYCEWWYRTPGIDTEYLAELSGNASPSLPEQRVLAGLRNTAIATELSASDHAICPTQFQARQFPKVFQDHMTIRHDGINTDFFAPGEPVMPPEGLPGDVPIVSYATRGMEPHRGFPQVISGLSIFLQRNPNFHVAIAGENRVFYGSDAARKIDWQSWAVSTLGPLAARVHFLGNLPMTRYRDLMRYARAHIYATVPFVPSWSLLEAMATEVPLVLSNTSPIFEFADSSRAAFFDLAAPESLADTLQSLVAQPDVAADSARRARAHVQATYEASVLVRAHESHFRAII